MAERAAKRAQRTASWTQVESTYLIVCNRKSVCISAERNGHNKNTFVELYSEIIFDVILYLKVDLMKVGTNDIHGEVREGESREESSVSCFFVGRQ
jgi:hypothetical protein